MFTAPILFAALSLAQTRGDAMMEKFLAAETDRLSQKFLDGAKTFEEWKEKRPRLQREYLDMLGLWPLPEKTPLKATVTRQLEANGVVVESLHYQSKPGLYVTANLYRPKVVKGKLPAILYVCGHSNRGRDGNKIAFQDHGFWFANNGYVCLVVDTLQLGEIPGVHHGTYGRPWLHLKNYPANPAFPEDKFDNRFWWHSTGYTPAGVEAWNGIRGIDYLISRPEVDPDKIGVTGISGGGAATFWVAAADERVKVAVPVSGMSDLESYVKNKVVNGHCDCMFLYNTYQWEWTTIAALVAPRPLLFANSDNDRIFPMDGNRRIIEKLRKLYGLYGKADLTDEYVSVGGHDYRPDLRIAIFKFINKHLKGDATTPVEDSAKFDTVEGKKLRVFMTDDELPKDTINHRIDETFITLADRTLPKDFSAWKKDRISELKAKVFRQFQGDLPKALLKKGTNDFLPEAETESGVLTQLVDAGGEGTLFVTGSQEMRPLPEWQAWFAKTFPDEGVWLYSARGDNIYPWTKKSPPNFVDRCHLLLGHTVDQKKVWDIVATARSVKTKKQIKLMGQGQAGILAVYAALFMPEVEEVVVLQPPTSHKQGPHFLNVLRVIDIPEALGLLAPRKLTIIGDDPAFDRTAALYRLAGAEKNLIRK